MIRRQQIRLLELARIDPLTGARNRRALADDVEIELALPTDRGTISLVMIDVDDFKSVNDRFGHHAGAVDRSRTRPWEASTSYRDGRARNRHRCGGRIGISRLSLAADVPSAERHTMVPMTSTVDPHLHRRTPQLRPRSETGSLPLHKPRHRRSGKRPDAIEARLL